MPTDRDRRFPWGTARALLLGVVLGLAGAARPVLAHDMWIEPQSFRPAPGATVWAHLLVGMSFHGDTLPRNDAWIERFAMDGPSGEQPMLGWPAANPAGAASVDGPGLYWIVYHSRPSMVHLDAEKIAIYAKDEGLDLLKELDPDVVSRGISDHFVRCAKALLRVGDPAGPAPGYDRVLGLPLELVPEADPTLLGPEGRLPVRLLRDGAPLEGALVTAFERSAPDQRESARSDSEGRVTLRIGHSGVWLVKAVSIAPVAGSTDEWNSFWASITFDAPERAIASP